MNILVRIDCCTICSYNDIKKEHQWYYCQLVFINLHVWGIWLKHSSNDIIL